jgi:hypothetical protein
MTTNACSGHFPTPTAVIVELTAATAVILPLDRYGRPSGLAQSAVGAVASLLSGGRMQAQG